MFNNFSIPFQSSATASEHSDDQIIPLAVKLLGELLSRPKQNLKNSYLEDYPEAFALNAILEVKVETAILNEDKNRQSILLIVCLGVVLLIVCSSIYVILLWRQKSTMCARQSEINLSVTDTSMRHDEEKSNNLQNEENFRRYAKGSALSLELTLSPIQENNIPGPSGMTRSQCIYPQINDIGGDFDGQNRPSINSQTLFKTQNVDVEKNIVQSIEGSNKDFDKRSIKCQMASNCSNASSTTTSSVAAISTTSSSTGINSVNNFNDILTVHV